MMKNSTNEPSQVNLNSLLEKLNNFTDMTDTGIRSPGEWQADDWHRDNGPNLATGLRIHLKHFSKVLIETLRLMSDQHQEHSRLLQLALVKDNSIIENLQRKNQQLEQALKDNQAKLAELTKAQTLASQETQETKEQQQLLAIETNEHEKKLTEIELKIKELTAMRVENTYQGLTGKATTIQAVFRGFMLRKQQPLSQLAAERQKEVKQKSPEVISQLINGGKYDQVAKLAQAIRDEHYHEAIQIIRGVPEQEIQLANDIKVKY